MTLDTIMKCAFSHHSSMQTDRLVASPIGTCSAQLWDLPLRTAGQLVYEPAQTEGLSEVLVRDKNHSPTLVPDSEPWRLKFCINFRFFSTDRKISVFLLPVKSCIQIPTPMSESSPITLSSPCRQSQSYTEAIERLKSFYYSQVRNAFH